jgi:hypothetical protein
MCMMIVCIKVRALLSPKKPHATFLKKFTESVYIEAEV